MLTKLKSKVNQAFFKEVKSIDDITKMDEDLIQNITSNLNEMSIDLNFSNSPFNRIKTSSKIFNLLSLLVSKDNSLLSDYIDYGIYNHYITNSRRVKDLGNNKYHSYGFMVNGHNWAPTKEYHIHYRDFKYSKGFSLVNIPKDYSKESLEYLNNKYLPYINEILKDFEVNFGDDWDDELTTNLIDFFYELFKDMDELGIRKEGICGGDDLLEKIELFLNK